MNRETRRRVLTAVVAVLVVSLTSIAGVGLAAAQPSERGGGGDAGGGEAGPSGDRLPSLPDQAADVAKDVLGTVGEFLSGGLEALGEALRGVTPGGGGGE